MTSLQPYIAVKKEESARMPGCGQSAEPVKPCWHDALGCKSLLDMEEYGLWKIAEYMSARMYAAMFLGAPDGPLETAL